ncbi:Meiotically up-regulated gene 65 protein [Yarrowia sp. C11]|nr:Meiotically up-regulated gene 65 protein [Yarrowia sp. E02]KAG5365179.1 Meiotically up-regulated gene 65 protein [Yarrowia sp. C11]
MGLLDKTLFAEGEPFSYDGNDRARRKLQPMDGSSLPLENTDFSAETLDRLVGRNVVSPASDYFHLGSSGEVSEEVRAKRELRERRLAAEEEKERAAKEARRRAERATWKDIEEVYGKGKKTNTESVASSTIPRETSQDASLDRKPPRGAFERDTPSYVTSLPATKTSPSPPSSSSSSSSSSTHNSDTKETHHGYLPDYTSTHHSTTSSDSFKDALDTLDEPWSDVASYQEPSTAKVTHNLHSWNLGGGDTDTLRGDKAEEANTAEMSTIGKDQPKYTMGNMMGRTHSLSIASRASAADQEPTAIVQDSDEEKGREPLKRIMTSSSTKSRASRENSRSPVRSKSPPLPAFTSFRQKSLQRVPTLNLPEGDGGNHLDESALESDDSISEYETEEELPTIDTAMDSSEEHLENDIDHLGVGDRPFLQSLESHLLPHDHHHRRHGNVRKKLIRRLSNNRKSSESSMSSIDSRDFSRPVQFCNNVGVPDPSWQSHEISDPEEISAPILPRFESLKKSTKGKKIGGGRKGRRRAAMEEEANGGGKRNKGKEVDDGYESTATGSRSRRQSVATTPARSPSVGASNCNTDVDTDVEGICGLDSGLVSRDRSAVSINSKHNATSSVKSRPASVKIGSTNVSNPAHVSNIISEEEYLNDYYRKNYGHDAPKVEEPIAEEDKEPLHPVKSTRSIKIDEPESMVEKRQSQIDPLYRPKPLPESRKSGESSRSVKSSKSGKGGLPHISRGVAMMMTGLSPTNSTPTSMRDSISPEGSEGWRSRDSFASRPVSRAPSVNRDSWSRAPSLNRGSFSRAPSLSREDSRTASFMSRDLPHLSRLRSSLRHSSEVSSAYPTSMDLNLPQGRTISNPDISIHHPLFHQQQRQHELEEFENGWSATWRSCFQSGCVPWNIKRWHTEADWNSTWGISWPWSKKSAPNDSELGGDLRRDSGTLPCIRVRGDPGPRNTNLSTMDHATLNNSACNVDAVHSLASRLGEDPADSLYDLADEEADMFEQGQYWGVTGDNPEVRPLSEAASQRGYVLDVIYENQRGMFVFGHPFFSSNSLLNFDRKPWTTLDGKAAPGDPNSYPLPNTNWQWAWKYWYIDMSGDVDDHGWSYSWFFRSRRWHGSHVWLHSFVRRRRWIRVRKAREFNKSEAITGRLERPIRIHDSLLEAKQRGDAHRAAKKASSGVVVTNAAAHDFMHAKYSVLVESAASAATWGDFWDVFTACRLDRERTAVIITCVRNPMNTAALTRLAQNPNEAIDQYQFSENIEKLCGRVTQLVEQVEMMEGTDMSRKVYEIETGKEKEGHKVAKPEEHLDLLQEFLDGIEEHVAGAAGFYSRLEQAEMEMPQTASTEGSEPRVARKGAMEQSLKR